MGTQFYNPYVFPECDNDRVKLIPLIMVFILCLFCGMLGFALGGRYNATQQSSEKPFVIYENKCVAVYEGAVIPFACSDSTLESN